MGDTMIVDAREQEYEDLAKKLHGRIRGTDQEYIICAAVHFQCRDKQIHQPVNIDNGIVICGRRHHNCFMTVAFFDVKLKEIEQGFVTSKDRFVNRKEAGEIAFKAGQTKELRTCLFSEDLY